MHVYTVYASGRSLWAPDAAVPDNFAAHRTETVRKHRARSVWMSAHMVSVLLSTASWLRSGSRYGHSQSTIVIE